MSNRSLILFLAAMVAAFVLWAVLDLKKTDDGVKGEAVRRDIVEDKAGGFGAAVQYDFTFPEPVIRHDLSTEEIGRLSGRAAVSFKEPGLTDAKFNLKTTYRFNSSKRWFGGCKMWVSDLTVYFGFTEITVYLSRDYPEGSCQYQAVMMHEQEHLDAHKRVWSEYQTVLREAMQRAPGIPLEGSPGDYPSEEKGKAWIEAAITAVTDPVFKSFQETDDLAQGQIDTLYSYESVRRKCDSW